MESSYLTALRTGLAGALGCDLLAVPDASRVAIVGAGVQGRAQLSALRLVAVLERPGRSSSCESWTPHPKRWIASAVTRPAPGCPGLQVTAATSLEDVLDNVQIAITAREPFLFRRHLHPGLHITTLGPD